MAFPHSSRHRARLHLKHKIGLSGEAMLGKNSRTDGDSERRQGSWEGRSLPDAMPWAVHRLSNETAMLHEFALNQTLWLFVAEISTFLKEGENWVLNEVLDQFDEEMGK
jgi:hypothetical protein